MLRRYIEDGQDTGSTGKAQGTSVHKHHAGPWIPVQHRDGPGFPRSRQELRHLGHRPEHIPLLGILRYKEQHLAGPLAALRPPSSLRALLLTSMTSASTPPAAVA